MGLLDLFRSKRGAPVSEIRSSGTGYTAQVMAARAASISGGSGLGELTATVQSCVTLWESGFALADVQGDGGLLTRRLMALTARGLALRGEAVFVLRGDRLLPAIDWDLTTRDGEPRAYRLSIPEASGARSETALAAEVLHFRIGSDALTPWSGVAPLRRAPLSAELLSEVEGAIRDVFRDAPIGSQIVPVPEGSADDMAALRSSFRGRRGEALIIEGVAQAVAAGMHPQLGRGPDQLSPDLSRTMADKLLNESRGAIFAAFGVLPSLFDPRAAGPLVREAQRHLAQMVLQPMAGLIAEEATAKLGAEVKIDVVRPMQAFDAGGKARALGAMIEALARAKEAGIPPKDLQDALSFIDWAD